MQTETDTEMSTAVTKLWWVWLVAGFAWLLFAWIVLSFRHTIATITVVGVLAGIVFCLAGINELVVASFKKSWRWAHIIFGIAAIGVGIASFVWPGKTFFVLALIVSWFLLFAGIFEIVLSISSHKEDDTWWLGLILGILELVIGLWAVSYPGNSIVFLLIWIGVGALVRGVMDIVLAFRLHSLNRAAAG